jgi:hypothetical protein
MVRKMIDDKDMSSGGSLLMERPGRRMIIRRGADRQGILEAR